jgi:hypothetical protein
MRKCSNFVCDKRNSCYHFIGRYPVSQQMRVKTVFKNNESNCNEYVKVGK